MNNRVHFRGLLPPNGILPGAKFTLRPNLAPRKSFDILALYKSDYYYYEPQSRFARLWRDMIIAQSDAHNFDAARSMLNSNAEAETATQLTTPDA